MNMILAIGALGIVIASAIALLAVRRARRARRHAEAFRKAEESRLKTDVYGRFERRTRLEAERQRQLEEEARVAADAEARRKASEQAKAAAEKEAQRQKQAQIVTDDADGNNDGESRNAVEQDVPREAKGEETTVESGPNSTTSSGSLSSPARAPRPYQPPAAIAPVVPSAQRKPSTSSERDSRDRALPLSVRLVFERAGFCRVSFLPPRTPEMPNEMDVSGSGDPPELLALQEAWYQDVSVPNMGQLLREGIEWVGPLSEHQQVRWSLGGREIYVLAPHDELNGYVNKPRLVLGEQHVVLCVEERLQEVLSAIALAGSPEPALLESSMGVPAGWIGLRGIVPRTPIDPSSNSDILNVLRPFADVEIALVGGIRIDRQTWLNGFPPRIRLRGDTQAISTVVIDGHEATLNDQGDYITPGWDSIGTHNVSCTIGSRTYLIRDGAEDWQPWDAYRWSMGEATALNVNARPAICGVLIRSPLVAHTNSRGILVPASNPVLIGSVPGEIYLCMPRRDVHAEFCVGFPSFDPVWALPVDAVRYNRRSAQILLVGPLNPVDPLGQLSIARGAPHRHKIRAADVQAWCAAIRIAGSKRLPNASTRSDVADLWKTYKQRAKMISRSMR